jgi:predicted nucleotidyltransferase
MAKKAQSPEAAPRRWYRGKFVPMRVIRRFARDVAEKFHPDKIILFGSRAYGTPHEDSDVDILVVMPARDQRSKAGRIRREVPAPFPLDIIVRTPNAMRWRLEAGDSFLREIVDEGTILYEGPPAGDEAGTAGRILRRHGALTAEWVQKAEGEYRAAVLMQQDKHSVHEGVCFHCGQAVENYLKALLQHLEAPVPRTRDLPALLSQLGPRCPSLRPLRRGLAFLTQFTLEVWEPGDSAASARP